MWTTTPWSVYRHFNDTNELQVRLSYSNSPLLEKLNVYVVEDDPVVSEEFDEGDAEEVQQDSAKVSP